MDRLCSQRAPQDWAHMLSLATRRGREALGLLGAPMASVSRHPVGRAGSSASRRCMLSTGPDAPEGAMCILIENLECG